MVPVLLAIYPCAPYAFATITAHVSAMYVPFRHRHAGRGTPPILTVLTMAYVSFCANVSTFSLDETSMFIRSGSGLNGFGGGVQNSSTTRILADLQPCLAK